MKVRCFMGMLGICMYGYGMPSASPASMHDEGVPARQEQIAAFNHKWNINPMTGWPYGESAPELDPRTRMPYGCAPGPVPVPTPCAGGVWPGLGKPKNP
jgi:hypothetical protein